MTAFGVVIVGLVLVAAVLGWVMLTPSAGDRCTTRDHAQALFGLPPDRCILPRFHRGPHRSADGHRWLG